MSTGINTWHSVCMVEDILPDSGVAAIVDEQEVALFRVGDAVYALGNYDPASGTNVLARGIVCDIGGELAVASPMYKQHYSLVTGRCLEDAALAVPAYLARVRMGQVWVRGGALTVRARGRKERLVVIGNGVAAMRVLEELLESAPQRYEISVYGEEAHGGYNRVLLSPVLCGEKSVADIMTHPPTWFESFGIALRRSDPIVAIDRARRCVRSRSGEESFYDRLLIATGSRPSKLKIPGAELQGVLSFRDLEDVGAMIEAAAAHRQAVVIGGGLLGLEAAHGLLMRGMSVNVVHSREYLMERQLDRDAGMLLRAELEARGLQFVMPAATAALHGEQRVSAVRLADGRELPADLVVATVGVQPNVELARAAGLKCERGILVDDTLLTSDPAIYAVGECVQHRGQTFGLVAPLFAQARICARQLSAHGARGFQSDVPGVHLKVTGIAVFSAGDHRPGPGRESLVMRDPKRGIYKRVVIQEDQVKGAVLYGDTSDGAWYASLINERRNIAALREGLLFRAPQ